jgi:Protein kinase domain/MalT-like TPR region/Tetratricopeptide repeat
LFEFSQTGELPLERSAAQPGGSHRRASRLFADGQLLLDRFRILRLLGRGGMGEVYEAEDLQLGKVALKTIRGEVADSADLLDRFRQEVQLARRVSHPNVCRIHELFSTDIAGQHFLFLTMEFLDGVTLSDRLYSKGPFPWREAVAIAAQIADALDAIHGVGLVHRDLKPRNIMLVEGDKQRRAVLTDFGLALESTAPGVSDSDGATLHSDSAYPGTLAGTPDSMAPEQFEGLPLSPATDIYAFGIVLYELVTGRKPFAALSPSSTTNPAAAAARHARRPVHPSSLKLHIPTGWDTVIDRCLEYEPARRYPSAAQVVADLRLRTHPVGHLHVRLLELARRPFGWALAAALLLVSVAGVWYWRSQHQYHHPSTQVDAWYRKGLEAIREGTYVKATLALQQAVNKDPRFAMAHARLAEAWYELDFTGNAQQEMLQASTLEQQQHLPELDSRYIHAIRDTLTHDYPGAAWEYDKILNRLPDAQRADGYVDLGHAHGQQGLIPTALADYRKATTLAPDSPAAFVHIGILESGLQHKAAGDAAFSRAETLYRADMNEEGLAEVAYQRGYAANDRGDSAAAEAYLKQSMTIAEQIPSIPMEIQALTQLSSVAADAKDDETAERYANQAIQLARQNGLQYWSALGLARLGASYLDSTDPAELSKAEQPLEEAIQIAAQSRQPGAEAEAALNLASLRDRQNRPDEVIPLAQKAHDLYMETGSYTDALGASNLLVRAQRNQGHLAEALRSSADVLASAKSFGNPRDQMLAEDLIGTVLLRLARYPDALGHFQNAESLGRTDWEKNFERSRIAGTHARMGMYSEAEKELALLPRGDGNDFSAGITHANILLSQNRYADALSVASHSLEGTSDKDREDFQLVAAAAELHLARFDSARKRIAEVHSQALQEHDPETGAIATMTEAALLLAQKSNSMARDRALQASQYFHASGEQDLEFFSLTLLARSQSELGDLQGAAKSARRGIDILHGWEQDWSPPQVQAYLHRPDVAEMLRAFQAQSDLRREGFQ